jgi:hypothetical protein
VQSPPVGQREEGAVTGREEHRMKEEGKGEGGPCVKMKCFVEIPLLKKDHCIWNPASHTWNFPWHGAIITCNDP